MSKVYALVTRPHPHGTRLCELIQNAGGRAYHFPTIAFAPPKNHDLFIDSVRLLDQQDWLIFISPQAVSASIDEIKRVKPKLPNHVQIAAVGASTAKALQQAGFTVSAVPSHEWNSESLLALPEFKELTGKKIAVVRGEGGRDYLENTLKAKHARVLSVIAYQRILPQQDPSECIRLLQKKAINIIICTSGEGVQNLKQLLGPKTWPLIKDLPLIVVSERIKSLASLLGFQTIWVAKNASDTAILAQLEHFND